MADARLRRIQLHGVELQTPIRAEKDLGIRNCRQVASTLPPIVTCVARTKGRADLTSSPSHLDSGDPIECPA